MAPEALRYKRHDEGKMASTAAAAQVAWVEAVHSHSAVRHPTILDSQSQSRDVQSRDVRVTGEPLPGDIVGAYRLISVLGEGSSGRVYAAQHETTRQVVALKLLYPALLGDAAVMQRFVNEARAVRRIRHANIVEISALIIDGRHHYLVMELLRGQTLETLIASAQLPIARALAIASEVCDALAAAHAVGVVHRDLKPGNVFISRRSDGKEHAMIIDFGVAKMLGATVTSGRDGARLVIGTPTYMAPEQTRGDQVDHRADIYALGVLLYEMVTGDVPFIRNTLNELIDAHRYATPPSPRARCPHLPESLERLILACLAKDPLERPVSMADVESALCAISRAMTPRRVPEVACARYV